MKIMIVTGASSGMGREVLLQLANRYRGRQMEVWAVARRGGRLEELRGQMALPLRVFTLDLADTASIQMLSDALKEARPVVEFLVNAAGFGKIGPVGRIPAEAEAGMIRVNCEAMCAVTRAVLPYMGRGGKIVQFASAAAFLPQPEFAVYAASKAFVLSYSRALGCELKGRGITVTAVCPGPVRTEFFDIAQSEQEMAIYKVLFMADPKKVARAAIRHSFKGKSVSTYGISMKLLRLLCKVVPVDAILFVMAAGQRRASKAAGKRKGAGSTRRSKRVEAPGR